MRVLPLIPALLLTSACWTPRPGQVDPTRYPWDQRKPPASYCVMTLDTGSSNGITAGGGNAVNLACKEPR